jgi:hypothetical protein
MNETRTRTCDICKTKRGAVITQITMRKLDVQSTDLIPIMHISIRFKFCSRSIPIAVIRNNFRQTVYLIFRTASDFLTSRSPLVIRPNQLTTPGIKRRLNRRNR